MGAVVVKKEEKVAKVFEALGDKVTETDFIIKFKEMYPRDWQRINQVFEEEERNTKPGKTHPMPHPDIYMKNMYKVAVKKLGEKQ